MNNNAITNIDDISKGDKLSSQIKKKEIKEVDTLNQQQPKDTGFNLKSNKPVKEEKKKKKSFCSIL